MRRWALGCYSVMLGALRSLRRRPAFAVGAVVVTSVGIASAATIIALLRGLASGPVPYATPGSIFFISGAEAAPDGLILPYWGRARLLAGISLYATGGATLSSDKWSGRAAIAAVSPTFFRVFGAAAAQGRTFAPADGERAVVVSHQLWLSGVRPGDSVRVGSRLYKVSGTMPASFEVPIGTAVWEPMPSDENPQLGALPAATQSAAARDLGLVARTRPGVKVRQAESELDAMFNRLQALEGQAGRATSANGVEPLQFERLREYLYGAAPPGLHLLIGGAYLMLLCTIAAAVGLFLARFEERRPEISLRLFLGARPATVIRMLLWESSLLCLLGAAVGLAGAGYLLAWLRRGRIGSLPQLTGLAMSTTVLLAALGAAMAILMLSVFAAWLSVGDRRSLRGGASGLAIGRPQRLFPRALIAAEIAAATALGCLGLTLTASYLSATRSNPGFAVAGTIAEPLSALSDPGALLRRVSSWRPGATFAVADEVPLADPNGGEREVSAPAVGAYHLARKRTVSRQYFSALEIPILAGKWGALPGRVAVSAGLARDLFGPRNPLGRRVSINRGPQLLVAAVVGDARDRGLGLAPPPMLYAPLSADAKPLPNGVFLLARAHGADGTAELSKQLPGQTGGGATYLLADIAARSLARTSAYLLLMGILAAGALALALASAFGTVCVQASRLEREIGVRAAFGAGPGSIRLLVLRRSVALGLYAVPAGLALGWVGRTRLAYRVSGLRAPWLVPFLVAAGVVVAALLIAALGPACRAARVSPAHSLHRG